MEPHQRIIIPAVSPSDLVGEQQMRAVLSETRRRRILDHATHATIRVGLRDRVPSVVDHVDDDVHLAQTDAAGWEGVKLALVVPFLGNLTVV